MSGQRPPHQSGNWSSDISSSSSTSKLLTLRRSRNRFIALWRLKSRSLNGPSLASSQLSEMAPSRHRSAVAAAMARRRVLARRALSRRSEATCQSRRSSTSAAGESPKWPASAPSHDAAEAAAAETCSKLQKPRLTNARCTAGGTPRPARSEASMGCEAATPGSGPCSASNAAEVPMSSPASTSASAARKLVSDKVPGSSSGSSCTRWYLRTQPAQRGHCWAASADSCPQVSHQ
mmetsp:Transcript_87667/g.253185  ORF Transcript_87667/g.253185 Transcript_87667/m.253185 type:complete len:234 (-) Transcript_87667:247-948(-)